MGHDKEKIEHNLENCKHNNITTTYELVLKRHSQNRFLNKIINSINNKNKPKSVNLQICSQRYQNNKSRNDDDSSKDKKDININIINYAAKNIGNININISNPIQCSHQDSTHMEGKILIIYIK